MDKLSKEGVLTRMGEFGKEIKAKADPCRYSVESHRWAEPYQKMLPALRRAYLALKNGDDPEKILRWLLQQSEFKTGIEANHLRLLLKAVTGTLPISADGLGWQVIDDRLIHVNSWDKKGK